VDRYLCRELAQFCRQTLDAFHEERRIGKARALRAPRAARKAIGARVDRDREGLRLGSRAVENVAAVPRANINDDATERGGYPGDLTDVDVDETLTEKSTHAADG